MSAKPPIATAKADIPADLAKSRSIPICRGNRKKTRHLRCRPRAACQHPCELDWSRRHFGLRDSSGIRTFRDGRCNHGRPSDLR